MWSSNLISYDERQDVPKLEAVSFAYLDCFVSPCEISRGLIERAKIGPLRSCTILRNSWREHFLNFRRVEF